MLLSFLLDIKDFRRKEGRRYELAHILEFSILGILSGATSYRKIHAFIEAQYPTLDEMYDLQWSDIPAYTTIRSLILNTPLDEMERVFRNYTIELKTKSDDDIVISCDGKVMRGSFDALSDQKAVQILSAFVQGDNLILAHEDILTKTSEIPAAQKLMNTLGLTNVVFTFDALHCQVKTLEVAVKSGNNVIVQVKENQPTLYKDCNTLAETTLPRDYYKENMNKIRNRIEERTVRVFEPLSFTHGEKWKTIQSVIKVERYCEVYHTKKKCWIDRSEISTYVSTTLLTAKEFCKSIRRHWGIENRNHYVRDVTLGEDKSRIRINPSIFAKLRSFALNIRW